MAFTKSCFFCYLVINNLEDKKEYGDHLTHHHNIVRNIETLINTTQELQKHEVKENKEITIDEKVELPAKTAYAGLPMEDLSGAWMDDDIVAIDMEDEDDNDENKQDNSQISEIHTKKATETPVTDKVKPSFAELPMDDMSGAWMDDDICASGIDEEEVENIDNKKEDLDKKDKNKENETETHLTLINTTQEPQKHEVKENKEITIDEKVELPAKMAYAGLPMEDLSGAWMDDDIVAIDMEDEDDNDENKQDNSQISEIPKKKATETPVTDKVKPSFAGLPMDDMSGAWMDDDVCASGMDEEEVENIDNKTEGSDKRDINRKKETENPLSDKVKPSFAGLPMDDMSEAWMDDDVSACGIDEEEVNNLENKTEDFNNRDISKNEITVKKVLINKNNTNKDNKHIEKPPQKSDIQSNDEKMRMKEEEIILSQTTTKNDEKEKVVEEKSQEKKKQKNKKSKKKDKLNQDDKKQVKETNKPPQKSKIEELIESIKPPSENVFVEKSVDLSNKSETKEVLPAKPIKSSKTSKKMDVDSVISDWLQGADDDDDSIPDELPDIEDKLEKQKNKRVTTKIKDVDEVLDIDKGSKITNIMDDSSNKNIKNAIDDWMSGGGHSNMEHKSETKSKERNENSTNAAEKIEMIKSHEQKIVSTEDNKTSVDKVTKEDEVPKGDCAVCGVIAKALCSGCKHVFYCTRDHQRQHWASHKEDCKSMAKLPYRVERNNTVGRFLVATQDLEEGELIMNESPMIVGPRQLTKPVCLGCHKEIPSEKEMIRCIRCNWPVCSERCQDSPTHDPECRATKAAGSRIKVEHFDQINMMYACITVLRALGLREGPRKVWEDYTKFDSHLAERIKTPVYSKVNKEKVVFFILQYLNIQRYSDLEILEACGKLDTNCFEIKQEGLNLRAMYRVACIMSHECTPNTRHTFDKDNSINIYTTKKIRKGQAVTATYTTSLWSTSDRRSHLWMSKCFWCSCQRCSDPTEYHSYLSAVRCSKCNHYLVPESPLDNESNWRCEKCDSFQKVGQIRTGNLTVSNELKEVDKSNLTSLTEFLTKWETNLGPTNHHIVEIKYTIVMLLANRSPYTLESLTKEQLELKISLSSQLLDLAEKIEPGMSRWRGILLLELQTAQVALAVGLEESGAIRASEAKERAETAMKNLRNAATILQVEPDMREVLQSRLGAVSKLLEKWEE